MRVEQLRLVVTPIAMLVLWAGSMEVSAQDWKKHDNTSPEHAAMIARLSAVEIAAIEECKREYIQKTKVGDAGLQIVCVRRVVTPAQSAFRNIFDGVPGFAGPASKPVPLDLCQECKLKIAIYCRGGVSELSALKGKKIVFQEYGRSAMLGKALQSTGAEMLPMSEAQWNYAFQTKDLECGALLDPPKRD